MRAEDVGWSANKIVLESSRAAMRSKQHLHEPVSEWTVKRTSTPPYALGSRIAKRDLRQDILAFAEIDKA